MFSAPLLLRAAPLGTAPHSLLPRLAVIRTLSSVRIPNNTNHAKRSARSSKRRRPSAPKHRNIDVSFYEEYLSIKDKRATDATLTRTTPSNKEKKRKAAKQQQPIKAAKVSDESIEPLKKFSLFASCLPGLEPILYDELVNLGFEPVAPLPPKQSSKRRQNRKRNKQIPPDTDTDTASPVILTPAQTHSGAGGIGFDVDSVESIMKCHLHLGTATHILLRCGDPFKARGMEELRRKVSKMEFWKQYLAHALRGDTVLPSLDIRVTASKSRLYHTEGIAERVERGILGALGFDSNRSDTGTYHMKEGTRPSIKLAVRIKNDYVQISVDTSDTPLHRRGYRLRGAKSPLREDLAYALLYGAGWRRTNSDDDGCTHLLDPCCGSGTIPIEGAAIAAGIPPGRLRPEPLAGSFLADDLLWKRLISDAESNIAALDIHVFGSDRDKGAIVASASNARRAGVSDLINWKRCAIKATPWLSASRHINAPTRLLIATNPPFGVRSSAKENVFPLYSALGESFSSLGTDASLAILAHDINLVRCLGLETKVMFSTKHGGLSVVAMQLYK